MKKAYIRPTSLVVLKGDDLMETLPIGGSPDYTDSGDDSGGGLAKKGFVSTDENEDAKNGGFDIWSDK